MGSGKSGGQSADPRYSPPSTAEGSDYLSRYSDVAASGMNPYYHYVDYGQNEGRTWGMPPQEGFDMEGMFASMFEQQSSDSAAQQADYEAKQLKIQQDAERAQAMSSIDNLFGSKLDAAERSATEINSEIALEQDNALMHGLDYSLSDEDKSAKINNRFAEYWSEGDDTMLGNLLGQWSPKGYSWDSNVVRGIADGSSTKKPPVEKKVGGRVRSTKSGSTVLTEDELGGSTTALGV